MILQDLSDHVTKRRGQIARIKKTDAFRIVTRKPLTSIGKPSDPRVGYLLYSVFQLSIRQDLINAVDDFFRWINDIKLRIYTLDIWPKNRIVRTAENECVELPAEHKIIKIIANHRVKDIVIAYTFFNDGNEERTRLAENANLRIPSMDQTGMDIAVDGHFRSDDTNSAASLTRPDNLVDSRLNDADNRNIGMASLQKANTRRANRIARDDNHLNVLLNQKVCDLPGKKLNRRYGFRSVWRSRRITIINNTFVRQPAAEMRDARQPTQA